MRVQYGLVSANDPRGERNVTWVNKNWKKEKNTIQWQILNHKKTNHNLSYSHITLFHDMAYDLSLVFEYGL
jgi:hypothetical protein